MYAMATDMNFSYTPVVSEVRELEADEINAVSGAFWANVAGGIAGAIGGGLGAFTAGGGVGSIALGALGGGVGGAIAPGKGFAGLARAGLAAAGSTHVLTDVAQITEAHFKDPSQ